MICQRCGARNPDESFYCNKCGIRLEDEQETVLATKNSEDLEKQIFSIRPTMLLIKIGYALAVLGAFFLVFLLHIFSSILGINIPSAFYVLTGLSMLLFPAYHHFRRNIVRYTLTDSKIEIDEGFIFQKTRNIPLRSIQDVSVESSIFQRFLGYGSILIDNASEDAGKIVLKNVDEPKKYADMILKQLRKLDR
ncbi:MAG: PH domain-containing protein [Pyrinomonadaceae bacterium]|nr:PH domain-containing protein [Pyrinomonadaceae bacterium]MCX7639317.1 PH domain-containing protein [Pyrinomonadaceae bacterium]